jgi:transposase
MAAIAQDTKMFAGIDVSKDKLDVHLHPAGEHFTVAQDDQGFALLVERLKRRKLAVAAIEATGGFEAGAVAALAAAGLPVAVVNPKQVRNFAKALSLNAKTDAIDARVIALFAEAVKVEVRPLPDQDTLALSELLARRRQVVRMITAEKSRAMRNASNSFLQKSIGRVIAALERELAELDATLDKTVKGLPVWRENEELLSSVPGIGRVIARTMLAEMPELGRLGRREVAALAGLAPWTRTSGQYRGKSMIGGGRSNCRAALYMGALTAMRHNQGLRAFAERLLNAGKSKKTVIIAVARKLLTILNAILRDRRPWLPTNA